MDEGSSIFFCRIKTIQLYYKQLSGEWKNAISQYMDKENNIIPQRQYTAVLRYCLAFVLFMQKQNILGIKAVAYSHLEDFIECTACISGKKRSQCLSVVRQFLGHLAGEGLCTHGFQLYIHFYLQNRPFLTPDIDEDSKYRISLWAEERYVSRRHAVRALLILYLFLDRNSLGYHKEISRIWFEYGKNIFQSGWKIARKSLKMFDEHVENGGISHHHDNYSVTKYDQLPEWCVSWVSAFLELKSKESMAKDTIANYLFSIARLCLFMERKGLASFMELSPEILKEFNIYDKHGSSAGKNSCNLRIRKFLIYLRSAAPYTKVGKGVCRDALCRALPQHSVPGLGFHAIRRTF